ncbi:DUF6480 family protein [Streptomyces avidinii]|uniref:DUF6480 family protein n=1 Tax=Streptomyces avidinii TaxID=1895 RepID=UPI00379277B4
MLTERNVVGAVRLGMLVLIVCPPDMSIDNPDPDPRITPDLEHGGSVPPGETPHAEAGTASGAGPYRPLKRGWSRGPLALIRTVAVLVALFFLVYGTVLALTLHPAGVAGGMTP